MNGEKKERIRKIVKERLKEISPTERKEKSIKITEFLLTHPFYLERDIVMVYLPLPEEVDTFPFIKKAITQGKKILVPWVKGEELIPVKLLSLRKLKEGRWGIPEPVEKVLFSKKEIQLVITPGLAFDRRGNRLGRGKGYFDRFFTSLPEGVKKIGLAFHVQIFEEIPVDSQDVPVDEVITEYGYLLNKF
ncbi:MAG TPA: 5-formyltetrahydrofolate cyclo-ligase [bacterium]|nr:5-formyltetrahydrofolate cyclo-ligase [bacterium]HEX68550.1 5-formyltetrahydrofolate cyclo-ligase [bacterium]